MCHVAIRLQGISLPLDDKNMLQMQWADAMMCQVALMQWC